MSSHHNKILRNVFLKFKILNAIEKGFCNRKIYLHKQDKELNRWSYALKLYNFIAISFCFYFIPIENISIYGLFLLNEGMGLAEKWHIRTCSFCLPLFCRQLMAVCLPLQQMHIYHSATVLFCHLKTKRFPKTFKQKK